MEAKDGEEVEELQEEQKRETNRRKKTVHTFTWERNRLYDRLACLILYQLCLSNGSDTTAQVLLNILFTPPPSLLISLLQVVECQSRPTSKAKPSPLNTIELQKEASRHFRLSSDRTMEIAEKLYQMGLVSYPRTETNQFSEGYELLPLVQEQSAHDSWGVFARQLLDGGLEWPRSGGQDDKAHPPIHPLKAVPLQDIHDPDERRLYELIARHFLAACSKDAKGTLSTVKLEVATLPSAGAGECFKGSGLMVLERNWLEVYPWAKWPGSKIPALTEGEVISPRALLMGSGRTEAPLPLSEVDLISSMDACKIGTDATIATHIKTIQDRAYVTKDASERFIPSKLGLALYEGYEEMGYSLMKPYLRAEMEKDMMRIARGELDKETAISQCLSVMKDVFRKCNADVKKLDEAMEKHFAHALRNNNTLHNNQQQSSENDAMISRSVSACGGCQGMMSLFEKREDGSVRSRYLFCATCARKHILPKNGDVSGGQVRCAICNFQVLTILNTETTKSHSLCPHCFHNPPSPPLGEEGISEFRCFACAHPSCSLAGRVPYHDVPIAPCICREGSMMLGKKNNKYIVSCSASSCRVCWRLPKHIKSGNLIRDTVYCNTNKKCLFLSLFIISRSRCIVSMPVLQRKGGWGQQGLSSSHLEHTLDCASGLSRASFGMSGV